MDESGKEGGDPRRVGQSGSAELEMVARCAQPFDDHEGDAMTEHDAVLISASELAELRKNAARYQWLRDSALMSDNSPWCVDFDTPLKLLTEISPRDGEDLDQLIDAAMKANK
jgi:hypothetical protein